MLLVPEYGMAVALVLNAIISVFLAFKLEKNRLKED